MTHGYGEQKDAITKRLHRIEGQVRGIERMVDDDRYCIDILDQISAITTALEKVALQILDGHVNHCVSDAMRSGTRGCGGEDAGVVPGRGAVCEVTVRPERLALPDLED